MASRAALFFDVFAVDRTRNTFSKIIKSTDSLGSKLVAVGKLAAVGAAAGLAVFATKGVKSFLEFDDKMTQSLAIMGEVSGPMRERMETAARAVGTSTRFGASEAAEAYFFLASAGLDAEQSVKALPQVAKFAQAGMFDLARATDLATDAQSALGLSVEDPEKNLRNLARVTDVLVGANTLANASTEQFATALTQKAGPAMRAAGIEIEQGVAVLAVFADQGRKGEEAGTLFAATLEQMQRKAIQNKDAFADLNIAVFDGQGNMRNMADIVADMEGALGGMSVEQQKATLLQLGFNRSALDGILALLGSSDAIRGYEADLQSMGGITEEIADKQLQSFAARLDLIKSRAADAALVLGEALVTAAFDVGETIGEMGRIFGELPDAVQTGTLAVLGIATAAPIAIGAFRKIRGAIQAVRLAFIAMSATARIATLSMGAVGLLLAAGATVLAFFANRNLEAKQRVDALAESLDRQTGAITENTREVAFNNLEQSGAIDKAKQLGISLETLVDAYLGDADAIAEVNAATKDATTFKTDLEKTSAALAGVSDEEAEAARGVTDAIREGNESTDEAIVKNRDRAAAGLEAAGADAAMADAADIATMEIEEQVSAVEELISSLDDMVSTIFAARDAEVDYEQAVDDATAAIEENGETLDINTEKGRKNRTALDRLAESALKDAAATLEDAEAKGDLAAGHDKATAKMETARSEFIKVARQMGLSKDAANALADELGLIPGNYKATVTANTGAASANVQAFLDKLNRIPAFKTVTMQARAGLDVARQHGGPVLRSQVALVGEAGPELVTFGQDAHVISANETQRILNRSGGNGVGTAGGGGSSSGRVLIGENHIEMTLEVRGGDGGVASLLGSLIRKGDLRLSANGTRVRVS